MHDLMFPGHLSKTKFVTSDIRDQINVGLPYVLVQMSITESCFGKQNVPQFLNFEINSNLMHNYEVIESRN